jgi:hypothetical protein
MNTVATPAEPAMLEPQTEFPMETNHETVDDYVYLIGRPTLRQFLSFVKNRALNGRQAVIGELTDEWRAAASHILKLEKSEAGYADKPVIQPLPAHLESLQDQFARDPLVQHGFNTVPTQLGLVELDRLVVYQHHIDLSYVSQLKERLGPAPDEEDIFRLCLPSGRRSTPVKWARTHRDTYVFTSPSNDLRFLGAMPLDPENVVKSPPPGALVGVVGLAVGFGSNCLSIISAYDRLILHNGSHRAYALRDLGITHAPCIIQQVYSREELNVVASSAVAERPDVFVRQPRPPMLKDYFDPSLRKILPVIRRLRQVTVKFEVDEAYVPAI